MRDRIGYLPEERGLYRKMKCLDQLAYLGELKGVPRAAARERAAAWLDRLGLGEWKERKVDALSKGDEVVTSGGMAGKITDMGENFIKVEVTEGVEVKFRRGAVESVLPKGSLKDM